MNRLTQRFDSLRAAGAKCLVPYLTAAYPSLDASLALLKRLTNPRIGAIEIGFPFSDPIADGPVIQTSFHRALERGFRASTFFAGVKSARAQIAAPLIAMVSYSIVFARGVDAFAAAAAEAGFDGLLVPDLSLEECETVAAACKARGLSLIMICAPTSDAARRDRIRTISAPFVYYQAVAGITGERSSLPADLGARVAELRGGATSVCVGFGISAAAQVREVCRVADGAIVGSAIVRRINEAIDAGKADASIVDSVAGFVDELAEGAA